MYHSFLIHSSADGPLGCFHVLAIFYTLSSSIFNNKILPKWSVGFLLANSVTLLESVSSWNPWEAIPEMIWVHREKI